MSFVPLFPVYANFTLRVNSHKKQQVFIENRCVGTKCWGSYDITSEWLVL